MNDPKLIARPWTPQDLLDDLQHMIDERPDNYINVERNTLCTAKAYLEEYFAKSTWISVKDRLPKWCDYCLCSVIVPVHGGGYRRDFRILCITEPNSAKWNCTDMIVTHWMPLPNPPEEEIL